MSLTKSIFPKLEILMKEFLLKKTQNLILELQQNVSPLLLKLTREKGMCNLTIKINNTFVIDTSKLFGLVFF